MFLKISFILCAFTVSTVENKYKLKQVVILSRHNVRTPLSNNLALLTPKPWPNWREKSGYLTAKGAYLERKLGSYFSDWLRKEGLLNGICPTEDIFYAYANTKQRTKASARSFVDSAFPGCNIKVHHEKKSDQVFNPVIHNATAMFRDSALKHMNCKLKNLSLNSSLVFLENVLDYKNSEQCKIDNKCDLCTDKNVISLAVGYKPYVFGPLKSAQSVIDAFVMSYYEGLPTKDVAWDLIADEKHWELIMEISKGYHDIIFNTTLVARDIAAPLIKYISNIFLNDDKTPKITLIMGHDANILTILNSLDIKAYTLQNQFEKSPVGGKVVFQKWYDKEFNRDLLKINYIYQSTEQLRDGLNLTLEDPPQFTLLELKNCVADEMGFCLWNDFVKLLKSLIAN